MSGEVSELTIWAGVALVPLIITLIEIAKRFFPKAHGNVWLGSALALGIVGQVAVQIADNGMPTSYKTWLTLIILGLSFGTTAAKTYDETLSNDN